MNLELTTYTEVKPHYLKMVIWRVLNLWLFPLLPRGMRNGLLRLFGAKIGKDCLFRRQVKFYAPWNFECGDAVCFGPRVEVYNKDKVICGCNIVVSQDSYLCTASHDISSRTMALVTKPIIINDNVWVAAKAIVIPGVILAEGTVVGVSSVVTRSTDPWTVVGGNPAKFIKRRELKD